MHTREPFEKAYKVYHVLGKGGFGIVYAGVRNHDGLQVAIKHIAKAKIKDWGQVSPSYLVIYSLRNHNTLDDTLILDKYFIYHLVLVTSIYVTLYRESDSWCIDVITRCTREGQI